MNETLIIRAALYQLALVLANSAEANPPVVQRRIVRWLRAIRTVVEMLDEVERTPALAAILEEFLGASRN